MTAEMTGASRRQFLVASAAAGGGLMLSFQIAAKAEAQTRGVKALNAYVKVAPDGTATTAGSASGPVWGRNTLNGDAAYPSSFGRKGAIAPNLQ